MFDTINLKQKVGDFFRKGWGKSFETDKRGTNMIPIGLFGAIMVYLIMVLVETRGKTPTKIQFFEMTALYWLVVILINTFVWAFRS